ncbi:MAG: SDR family NAD(P)-dependent oxidoreductase [Elusimicrobia bacterium]|nr:SDR family NAD(P)-dependent oxidoreductase [Elusimicrobiota bacterium]
MKRAVVTGATSGLGREIAVQLGRAGWRVALTGRREPQLKEAAAAVRQAGGTALELLGSVSDPDAVKAHYALIKEAWGGLDWAVLNAGGGDKNNAKAFSAANLTSTIATNLFGVAYWMEAVIPDMVAAGSGTVAAVSSLAGFRGLPSRGSYCASKAALNTMLESARIDLRPAGVRVVTVCPGFVKSELTDRNNPAQMPFLLDTPDGARRIIRGIAEGRRLVHFPWQLSLPVMYLLHNLPGWAYDRIAARLERSKRPADAPAEAAKQP